MEVVVAVASYAMVKMIHATVPINNEWSRKLNQRL